MKILIVSAYFTPEITPRAFRTTELVLELLKRNHDVFLYIPYKNNDYTHLLEKYSNLHISYLTDSEIHAKLPLGKEMWKRGLRFLYSKYAQFTCHPFIKLKKAIPVFFKNNMESSDLLVSIAAPHAVHWGVADSIEKGYIKTNKWIADCGDPFMGDETLYRPFYFKKYEIKFCSLADYITVPIENAVTAYYPKFREKIKVIPQGFDFSEYKNLGCNYRRNMVPTFAYAGSLYLGYRDLNSFVSYLSTLNYDFKFIVYTPKSVLVDSYKNLLHDKLIIKSFIPRNKLLYELSTMDFLVNIENKGKAQLPSKLIDYALTNRPVLSVSNRINKEKVLAFLKGDYKEKMLMPNLKTYEISNVVDKFLKL